MLFRDPVHQPFSLPPEDSDAPGGPRSAALLLHGYFGSPAELRPLGGALAAAGVRADTPALPGFGPDVDRIGDVSEGDWVEAAGRVWATVVDAAEEATLVGFSMGGALALTVAAELAPARLVLIEPFQRIPDWRARLLPFAGPFLKEIKPYQGADFSRPETRAQLSLSAGGLDLDDPAVQAWIREEATMPISSLQALARLGAAGLRAAPRVTCPTLIVQASPHTDESFGHPDRLVAALGGPTRVVWVEGDHQLVRDDRPSWPRVRDLVVAFARGGEVTA